MKPNDQGALGIGRSRWVSYAWPNLTDIFNDPENIENQVRWMDRLSQWHSPGEILIMATGTAGELLKLGGIRNSYPGELGVVKEGAYADLLLVDATPWKTSKSSARSRTCR